VAEHAPAGETRREDATAEKSPAVAPHGAGSPAADSWRQLRRNRVFLVSGSLIVVLLVVACVPQLFAGWFGNGDPRACDLSQSRGGPAPGHPFGFDSQGCDLYANVIYGAGPSIFVGVATALLCFLISVVLGTLSGYFGGWIDLIMSRVADVFFGFPFILGAIIILITVGRPTVLTLIGVLALFGWPYLTRLMRSSVIRTKDSDFVVATRALGASNRRILVRHVLPNSITPTLVIASLSVGGYIVAEAGLTYIGLGLHYPTISWGLQLAAARGGFQTAPHMLFFPALFLSVTVLSFVLLGDAVRDALNPRLR